MKAYRELFESMFMHLRKNQLIEVQHSELLKPASSAELKEIEHDFAVRLDPQVHQFYEQVGGVKLVWQLKKPILIDNKQTYTVHGNINILPIKDVFWGRNNMGWHNTIWFDHTEANLKDRLMNLKPVDLFDEDDTGCVSFEIGQGLLKEHLVLFSVDNGLFDLKIKFDTYLNLLLASCGLFRWQFLLAPTSYAASGKNLISSIQEVLPKIIFNMQIESFHATIKQSIEVA